METTTLKPNEIPEYFSNASFTLPNGQQYVSDDGKLIVSNNELVMDSRMYRYKDIYAGVYNDLRFVYLSNNQLPAQGGLKYKIKMSNKQEYNCLTDEELCYLNIFNPCEDYNLCAGALVTLDNNANTADFFFTDNRLYVLYERLAYLRTPQNNYYAYTYLIPVKRLYRNEKVDVAVSYTPNVGLIWEVNGKQVFSVPYNQIGMGLSEQYRKYQAIDLGGTPQATIPESYSLGFGNFTLVDGLPYRWDKHTKAVAQLQLEHNYYYPGTQTPMRFVLKNDKRHGLVGQGNISTLYEMTISINFYNPSNNNITVTQSV